MNGRAQTVVCATPITRQRKQRLERRANLLPKPEQKQLDFATDSPLIGYARVSKAEGQELAPQLSALEAAGCRRVYEEKARAAVGTARN